MYLYALLSLPIAGLAYPTFENRTSHTTLPHRPAHILPINTHYDHIYGPPPGATHSWQSLHPLQPRDSITIDISSSFANTTVSNTQNNARFQVINNAKNSAIAVGDDATHNVTLDSFGDKNMINSTGSATGGWNTKNHGTNISTEPHKLKRQIAGKGWFTSTHIWIKKQLGMEKRDLVNLNIMNGKVKGSNMTRSGTGNIVELYIAGNGDNVVNVTIAWEAEKSDVEDSENNNTVKIYIGDMKGDMGNNTVIIV